MLGWLALALGFLLSALAVLLVLAGLGSEPLLAAGLVVGGVAVVLYRTGRERVVNAPYERLGVEQNDDGTVGTPGADHERSRTGADYDPGAFEDPADPEEWPWDDPFWYDAEVDPDRNGSDSADAVDSRTREACDVLGVEPGADAETVRAAYRERVKEAHPDQGGSAREFERVRWAYEQLREDGERDDRRRAAPGAER